VRYLLAIGGVTIAINVDSNADARTTAPLGGPIAHFVVSGDAPADIDVRVHSAECTAHSGGAGLCTVHCAPCTDVRVHSEECTAHSGGAGLCTVHCAPCTDLLFDSGSLWRLFADGADYRFEFRSSFSGDEPYKIARVAKAGDGLTVDLQTRVTEYANTYPLQFPLDELLVNAVLTQQGGIELHSCGVVDRNGDGYLFAGNSGGGKTTTARLWQGEAKEILSDDRIILRRENGQWWMYGTPWHGEAEICSASRAPLRRIFLLDKAGRNELRPLSQAAAIARLFSCTFPPFHDAGAMSAVVGTLAEIVRDVPVAAFSFVKDPSAVGFVRDAFEAAA